MGRVAGGRIAVSGDVALGARMLAMTVAVVGLGAAAIRISSRLTIRPELRIISAATVGCFAAIAEALLLGLLGIGENGVALLVSTIVLFAVVRVTVPAATGPRLGAQLAVNLRALRRWDAAGVGALAIGGLAALVDLLWRPYSPYDGLQYHLAEPVLWLHDGHPGSLHVVNIQTPLQAYPRNTEVLVGWLLGLSHSFEVGTLLMFGLVALALVSTVSALAALGVGRRVGVLIALAVVTLPVSVLQLAGASTDVATLAWIVATAALCFAALSETALLPVVVVAGGLALGTKASAAVPVAVGVAVTLWLLRDRLRAGGAKLATGAVLGIGLAALWYLQDWVVYGAPLYPFSRVPSGPVLPQSITDFNTSFAQHPIAALRAGTFHGYLRWFGGGPFLVLGALASVALVPVLRARDRRVHAICVGCAAAALTVWAIGPFTGYPDIAGTSWFPLNGTRYLLPSMPIVMLPIAVASQRRRWLHDLVVVGLLGVIAVNIYELRHWPPPLRPPAVYVVGGLLLGAALGAWLSTRSETSTLRPPSRIRRHLGFATATVFVMVTALLAAGAAGYLRREISQHQRGSDDPFSVSTVIGWLDQQPDWVHGHQPVAAGPILDALLAGPRLSHQLVLVPQTATCAEVQQLNRADWLVLAKSFTVRSGPYRFVTYTRADCVSAAPAFSGGGYLIYQPTGGTLAR